MKRRLFNVFNVLAILALLLTSLLPEATAIGLGTNLNNIAVAPGESLVAKYYVVVDANETGNFTLSIEGPAASWFTLPFTNVSVLEENKTRIFPLYLTITAPEKIPQNSEENMLTTALVVEERNLTEVPTDGIQALEEQSEEQTQEPMEEAPLVSRTALLWNIFKILLTMVLFTTLLIFVIFKTAQRQRRRSLELLFFIHHHLERGVTQEVIDQKALDAGWASSFVKKQREHLEEFYPSYHALYNYISTWLHAGLEDRVLYKELCTVEWPKDLVFVYVTQLKKINDTKEKDTNV